MPTHQTRRITAVALAAASACALTLSALPAAAVPAPITYSADDAALSIAPIGTFATGVFDASAAEIVAAHRDRLFVVNALAGSVSVLDYSSPSAISEEFTLSSEGVANSVAVRADGLGVVAFEAPVKTDPGHLVFFDANASGAARAILGTVEVGAQPDMVAISADGRYAVVANEGELADDFALDPEGSVSVVALPKPVKAAAQKDVRTATFHAFEAGGSKTLPDGVRVFGPRPHGDDRPVSRNLEPEFVTIDGGTAYVALQEANAFAAVDLASATVTGILPLGFKDHGLAGSGLDPSDRDPRDAPTFGIRTFPGLHGVYMPDGIASYRAGGQTYLVTANEGDAREWGSYVEAVRVGDLAAGGFGPVCADSPLAGSLGAAQLGRLNVTKELGFDQSAGCYRELYAFGARSFSIWTTAGERVFDSGDEFERLTHAAEPRFFNSNHTEANLEGRSDDKGPEPENLAIGEIAGRTYAFIGFERVGGIAVYDITVPAQARFVTHVNNRDFTAAAGSPAAGDLGAEGVTFIPAVASATGAPLLAVANEVSGTTTLFAIADLLAPQQTVAPTVSGSARAGGVLTATSGEWDAAGAAFAYQWLRDGEPIARATGPTFRVTGQDHGHEVSVRVTATVGASAGTADSAAVRVAHPGKG